MEETSRITIKNCVSLAAVAILFKFACMPAVALHTANSEFGNSQMKIVVGCGRGCLWQFTLQSDGVTHRFSPPIFEVGGKAIAADIRQARAVQPPMHLQNGATEYDYEAVLKEDSHLTLGVQFQVNPETPVIRFRYTLRSDDSARMTKSTGADHISFLTTSFIAMTAVTEIKLSDFVELAHSYMLSEDSVGSRFFQDRASVMGPILAGTNQKHSFLVAYEHGSEVPNAFLRFQLQPNQQVDLVAVKGNYLSSQVIGAAQPFESVWFETAAVSGNLDRLASAFRKFVLRYQSRNFGSRRPFIFYNTWNMQERDKWSNGRQYGSSMNSADILKQIDVAHRMGIEVFVLDTGWFGKTGDWKVNRERFPNGLKPVKEKLDGYGMKLGLWISPTRAAISSVFVREHPEWRMTWNGKPYPTMEVWGTEDSAEMCLVSSYGGALADKLIQVAKETGATYFKWDGVGPEICNDPRHWHGGAGDSPQDRADSYSFQLVLRMSQIVNRVAAAVPGAIVDFDMTESDRPMGLAFLSSGKYFLMNNGPYYQDYDLPIDKQNSNWNLFFRQGQARSWIARTPLGFDRWIPSILFMTHYFPDDPKQWQEVSVASLILGQNGIWGDLLGVSDSGIEYIGSMIRLYKQVRDDITESDPIVTGIVSGTPEIHEKISSATGRGAIVAFATAPGRFTYVSSHRVQPNHWASEGVIVAQDAQGRAKLNLTFEKPGAKIVFFGVHSEQQMPN